MPTRPLPLFPEELPADFDYRPTFLAAEEADALFRSLVGGLPWVQHRVRMFGRELPAPRLSSWHGDPQASYGYSGRRYIPLPWIPALLSLRDRLGQATGIDFNGVLANLYRNGSDSMGWHADDEPELGCRPVIASLSFGAERAFDLKRRDGSARLRLLLGHGSLLLMQGDSQRDWLHALPRSRRVNQPRLNLTFRRIISSDSP